MLAAENAVWARGRVVTKRCPKSLIAPQSYRWLELHRVWSSLGRGCLLELDAKSADALQLLEDEISREEQHEPKE